MFSKILFLAVMAGVLILLNHTGQSFAQDESNSAGKQDSEMYGPPPDFNFRPFCWMEFRCADNERTAEFYQKLFGWQITPYEEMDTYYFFQPKSGLMGGFNSSLPEDFQNTIVYIYVPDVDVALEEVESAGGMVAAPKMPVSDWGHIAFVKDPAGVVMGVSDMYMPPAQVPYPFGEGDKPEANTICFFEVFAGENMEISKSFYADVFGWKTSNVEGHQDKTVFSPGAGVQGVFLKNTEGIEVLAYIWVDDVNAALNMVAQEGGEVLYGGPITAPHVAVFGYFKDPSGVVVGLLGEK